MGIGSIVGFYKNGGLADAERRDASRFCIHFDNTRAIRPIAAADTQIRGRIHRHFGRSGSTHAQAVRGKRKLNVFGCLVDRNRANLTLAIVRLHRNRAGTDADSVNASLLVDLGNRIVGRAILHAARRIGREAVSDISRLAHCHLCIGYADGDASGRVADGDIHRRKDAARIILNRNRRRTNASAKELALLVDVNDAAIGSLEHQCANRGFVPGIELVFQRIGNLLIADQGTRIGNLNSRRFTRNRDIAGCRFARLEREGHRRLSGSQRLHQSRFGINFDDFRTGGRIRRLGILRRLTIHGIAELELFAHSHVAILRVEFNLRVDHRQIAADRNAAGGRRRDFAGSLGDRRHDAVFINLSNRRVIAGEGNLRAGILRQHNSRLRAIAYAKLRLIQFELEALRLIIDRDLDEAGNLPDRRANIGLALANRRDRTLGIHLGDAVIRRRKLYVAAGILRQDNRNLRNIAHIQDVFGNGQRKGIRQVIYRQRQLGNLILCRCSDHADALADRTDVAFRIHRRDCIVRRFNRRALRNVNDIRKNQRIADHQLARGRGRRLRRLFLIRRFKHLNDNRVAQALARRCSNGRLTRRKRLNDAVAVHRSHLRCIGGIFTVCIRSFGHGDRRLCLLPHLKLRIGNRQSQFLRQRQIRDRHENFGAQGQLCALDDDLGRAFADRRCDAILANADNAALFKRIGDSVVSSV